MKAFLLAAGYGVRLRPITDTIPKCMVPIHGQPLLGWWFWLLRRHGVTEVLVNTHYLPEPVREYIQVYNSFGTGLTAYEAYEPVLLGSGGTIRANRDFVSGEKDFLICYADNLTDVDLTAFANAHRRYNCPLTMALFHTNMPKMCGIAEMDSHGCIVAFTEKPEEPKSNLANAGMYMTDGRIFNYLEQDRPVLDFGKDEKANEEWTHDHHEDAATNQFYRRRD